MQKVALTIYAVPVPPANQGRVTRYTEYDISRAPKAIVMQNMRASTVIVHIRSASLCLFSLGKGGTKQAAKARLMAWASMAPLCKHLIFMYLSVRSFVHAFVHLSVPSFLHPSIHSSIHPVIHSFILPCIHPCMHSSMHPFIQASCAKLIADLAHDTGAKYAKCMQVLCGKGGRLLDADKLNWC